MGADIDPYRVLGVSKDATLDEIHDAYRRLARRLHPDVGRGDPAEMAQLNEAWAMLRDSSDRDEFVAAPEGESLFTAGDQRYEGSDERVVRVDGARLRVMVLAAVAVLVIVFIAVFLIGFGRVGVSGQP